MAKNWEQIMAKYQINFFKNSLKVFLGILFIFIDIPFNDQT